MTSAPSAALTCSADLVLDLTAPHAARTLVRLVLLQWGLRGDDVLDNASLVATELVTNAVAHTADGARARVHLRLDDERLRVAVDDASPVVPRQRRTAAHDETGRGLAIVTQLAVRWGVEPAGQGKRVYADLARTWEDRVS